MKVNEVEMKYTKWVIISTVIIIGYLFFSFTKLDNKAELQEVEINNQIVKVFAGIDIYNIPAVFLSPKKNELPAEMVSENSIEVALFLPDFSGYKPGKNEPTVGKYDINQITLYWTHKGAGGHFEASKMLSNGLKYGVFERSTVADTADFIAYKHLNDNGMSFQGITNQGDVALINCTEGMVNSTCKVEYLNQKRNIGIFFSFDKIHLKDWKVIDSKVIELIDSWKETNN